MSILGAVSLLQGGLDRHLERNALPRLCLLSTDGPVPDNFPSGLAQLNECFKNLPPSQHTVLSVDCQPVPMPGASMAFLLGKKPFLTLLLAGSHAVSMLVTVTGVVSYANSAPRTFSQAFILAQDPTPVASGQFCLSCNVADLP
jgi:hypothetical protein